MCSVGSALNARGILHDVSEDLHRRNPKRPTECAAHRDRAWQSRVGTRHLPDIAQGLKALFDVPCGDSADVF